MGHLRTGPGRRWSAALLWPKGLGGERLLLLLPSVGLAHSPLSPPPAKKLPKSEPQSTSGVAGRSRGVDLHEQSQQNKSQCCSN